MKCRYVVASTLVLLLLQWGVPSASGQVGVEASLSHAHGLLFEPAALTFTIRNEGGQVLDFSGPDANASLVVEIKENTGRNLAQKAPIELDKPLVVLPQEEVSHELTLQNYFELNRAGAFHVMVYVEWADHRFSSEKQYYDISPGREMISIVGTAPVSKAVRTYSLRTLYRGLGNYLFLRIDDPRKDQCLAVFELGRILNIYPPEIRLDDEGYLNILHHSGPAIYTHSVFTADGAPVMQNTHDANGRASLSEGAAGRLSVAVTQPPPTVLDGLKQDEAGGR